VPETMAVAAGVPICTVYTVVDPSVAVGLSLNGSVLTPLDKTGSA
jgi:hypothetical protein